MKENKYSLGLVSVSFRSHTPEEILKAVKDAGLTCIEWGSDVHAPCNDMARLQEIAELQKKYKIDCSSYGTYFRFLETPFDELKGYIAAAKILGTDTLRLWCGNRDGEQYSDREKQELIAQCKKAAELAEKEGVTLCMECHKNTFTERLEDALSLMREVGSPCFRMYWQPFQWQSVEENQTYARSIAPYTEHIHVFNWKDDKKLQLAQAVTQWRKYLNEFSTPRTLLLEFMPNGTVQELMGEADALRSIIGESV